MNRVVTVLIALAVVAVGVVAALDAFGNESTAADEQTSRSEPANRELIGPHSPEPGALAGTLVVARGANCVIQLVDLTRMRFSKAGPESGCFFSVGPSGKTAAVLVSGEDVDSAERRFELVDLDGRPTTTGDLGQLLGDPVWSLEGTRIAACHAPTSAGTTVASADGGPRDVVHGCWPAFGADGGLVTRSAVDLTVELPTDGIFIDGVEVITPDELLAAAADEEDLQGFVLGHTGNADGVIAVSLVHSSPGREPSGSLQLWRNLELASAIAIPLFLDSRGPVDRLTPAALRDVLTLSPDGDEVAIVLEDGEGALFLVDARTGSIVGPIHQLAYDWSPDSNWLAVASGVGIDVYGPSRDEEPTFQLPLLTRAPAWR